MKTMLEDKNYKPNALLDFAIEALNLKNDAALARALEVAPPQISMVRHRLRPIGPTLLLKLHDLTALSAKELRRIAGMP